MKLRNKKTGAIYKIEDIDLGNNADGIWLGLTKYNSLAELNEEWEDYEEPKEHWYIYGATPFEVDEGNVDEEFINELKEIGNFFETREEAEKVVEKLKAWKRLKEEGAEFYGWQRTQTGTYVLCMRWKDKIPQSYEVYNELHLLFGGEE